MWSRERRCELLGTAPHDRVVELAETMLDDEALANEVVVVHRPETGSVVLQVREPVCGERVLLADVVVTRAEVAVDGHHGWVMRPGTDRVAAFAGALCDAVSATSRADWSHWRARIDELCADAETAEQHARSAEWAEIAPTIVEFEALD